LTTPNSMLASGMSEAEAIEGAKQGDGECFEFLYKLHKRRVYSLCLRMIRDIEAAEDLTLRKPFSSSTERSQAFAEIPRFPLGCIASRSTLSSCAYASAVFQ
jgi:hypothetical protein